MEKPYLGVTGFTARGEVEHVLATLPEMPRPIMVGVLVSEKTLVGRTNKYPHRYPKIRDVKTIFSSDPRVLNLIHYHSRSYDSLFDQLCEMAVLVGPCLHGFQLNIPFPPPEVLSLFRREHPEMRIVLQINNKAFSQADYDPARMAQRLKSEYSGLADYAILDLNQGNGWLCSSDLKTRFVKAIEAAEVPMRMGLAGDVGVHTLYTVKDLLHEHPGLCVNAESRLRTEEDGGLILDLAIEFLRRAAHLISAA